LRTNRGFYGSEIRSVFGKKNQAVALGTPEHGTNNPAVGRGFGHWKLPPTPTKGTHQESFAVKESRMASGISCP
jgi:hypothetical protein